MITISNAAFYLSELLLPIDDPRGVVLNLLISTNRKLPSILWGALNKGRHLPLHQTHQTHHKSEKFWMNVLGSSSTWEFMTLLSTKYSQDAYKFDLLFHTTILCSAWPRTMPRLLPCQTILAALDSGDTTTLCSKLRQSFWGVWPKPFLPVQMRGKGQKLSQKRGQVNSLHYMTMK